MFKILITADNGALRRHNCNEWIRQGNVYDAEIDGECGGYRIIRGEEYLEAGNVRSDMAVKCVPDGPKKTKIKNYKLSVRYENPMDESLLKEEIKKGYVKLKDLNSIKRNLKNLRKKYGTNYPYVRNFIGVQDIEEKRIKLQIRENIRRLKEGKRPVYRLIYKNLIRETSPLQKLTPKEIKNQLIEDLDIWIKENRQLRGFMAYKHKSFHGVGYRLLGGVHEKKGTIIELFKKSFIQRVKSEKKPKTKDNYIGVELEFTSPLDDNQITENLAKKGLGKYVTLKGDGSIRCTEGDNPYEICILAKQDEYKEVVKKVCKTINDECEAGVNSTCGLHVHLDMRNRQGKDCAKRLFNTQDLLYSMVPKRRRTHQFCRKLDSFNFDTQPSGERYDHGRYYGLNFKSLQKFNTIEVRLHSGSTNHKKINNWIDLLLNIVDNDVNKKVTKLDDLNEIVKMDEKLSQYLKTRVEAFN